MRGAGIDTEDVVEEKRQRVIALERLSGGEGMLFERFNRRHAVEADQLDAFGGGHAKRAARRRPSMTDANAHRLRRQHFEGHHRVGIRLGPEEYMGPRKLRIVAGAAAGELVFTGGQHRQLIDQVVGMPGERIGHDESGAIRELRCVNALE